MSQITSRVGERLIPGELKTKDERLHFLKHLFPYENFKPQLKGLEVLEIGCGEGYGAATLSASVKSITGVDVDPAIILHAEKKYGSANCLFKVYDGNQLPFANHSFDAIVSLQVIEHIMNDEQYLGEIVRVLRPGGVLILTTPNRVYRLKPGQKPWNRFHVREYEMNELKKLVGKFFDSIECLGIRATDEIQRYEFAKVKSGFYRYDFLNLRHYVPDSVKVFLRKLVVKNSEQPLSSQDLEMKYDLKDYYIIRDRIDLEALDLLIIARTRAAN